MPRELEVQVENQPELIEHLDRAPPGDVLMFIIRIELEMPANWKEATSI